MKLVQPSEQKSSTLPMSSTKEKKLTKVLDKCMEDVNSKETKQIPQDLVDALGRGVDRGDGDYRTIPRHEYR